MSSAIDWPEELSRHARWLRTVVFGRLGDGHLVDDLLQEIGLAVSKADTSKVAPWLYQVAVRQCLMFRRKLGRQRRLHEGYASHRETVESSRDVEPMHWLMQQERSASLRLALQTLPELDRQILLLKHLENWTYQQLADHLGVSIHTIEHRLLKARKTLRRQLSEEGVEA
jgi:RNA polymerase sigma factor (sigma-70 family)